MIFQNSKRILITMGDYNGIGPEIITKALYRLKPPKEKILVIGSKRFLPADFAYEVEETPAGAADFGKDTAEGGEFSYKCLKTACDMAKSGKASAIVTAPVSKNALHLAGYDFSGQTEILEQNLAKKGQKVEMLFVSGDFRVMLLTRHLALKDVKITKELLEDKIRRLNDTLRYRFKIKSPKIALCSLNPHAGENGILGKEEIEEFEPALKNLKGINVTKPLPADTLFVKAAEAIKNNAPQPYDCYVACYHDQGLIPMKVLASKNAVNMTIGLDVVRTSPAHGTAYDIVAKNCADPSSLMAAIEILLKD